MYGGGYYGDSMELICSCDIYDSDARLESTVAICTAAISRWDMYGGAMYGGGDMSGEPVEHLFSRRLYSVKMIRRH